MARGHLHLKQVAKDLYHRYKDETTARAMAAEMKLERADGPLNIYDD